MIFFLKGKHNNSRYTFNKDDYNHKVVFLKRLEGGKIFFDNQIYDKDFFDYKKLRNYIKIFYIYRQKYINYEFNKILKEYKSSRSKMSFSQRYLERPKVKYYNPKRKIIHNLTKAQYNVLVKAFTFNFTYGHFSKKRLSYHLYRFGWFSIKPVYTVFKQPLFSFYNEFGRYMETYEKYIEGGGLYNRTSNQRKVGFFEEYKEAFMDGIKAKDNPWPWIDDHKPLSEKERKYFLHIKKKYRYSKDPAMRDDYWDYFFEEYGVRLDNVDCKEAYEIDDVLEERDIYEPFVLEYDSQKKYNEYDIYSKTNTRYARYITYNKVYYKNYKGKKFSTKNYFDYTDEEIEFNFNNMINNKGPKKYEECISLYKNVKYMREFFEMMNEKYSDRLEPLIRGYKICRSWGHLVDWEYNNKHVLEEMEAELYRMLYDPRYILIMPVLDAYFEMVRYDYTDKDWDNEVKWEYPYIEHEFNLEETMSAALFSHTIEYKEYISLQDHGTNYFNDYELINEDYGLCHRDEEFFCFLLAFIVFCGVTYYSARYLGYFLPVKSYPFTLQEPIDKINTIHLNHLEWLKYKRPKVYFELANRKPRYIHKPLPPKFYLNQYYSYTFHHGRKYLPFTPLDIIQKKIDARDFSLRTVHNALWYFGKKLGYR